MNIIGNKTTRQSGIELLRLIAMLMVLLLHANFLSFGAPTAEQIHTDTANSIGRIFLEHLCIVAVNVYVLISGWFGIKPKVKSITNLIIQAIFYSIVGVVVAASIDSSHFSKGLLLDFLIVGKPYWFVVSYILLYIVSPVLNKFVEYEAPQIIKLTLLCFFSFEFVYGWLFGQGGFGGGYSTMSFIGLYILARYLRIHGGAILKYSTKAYVLLYLLMTTIMTSIVSIQLYLFKTTIIGGYLLSYDSPLIILSSLFLFLLFEKMIFYSSFINACSSSALSIYLIHINPHIWGYFKEGVLSLYNISPDYYGCLLVFLYLLVIMSICILIDKIRLKLTPMNNLISIGNIVWNKISTII